VIKDSVNDTITDGLGNNLLGLLDAFERQLLCNVLNGYLGVADVDLLEAKLDNSVSQALNQGQILVCLEETLVLGKKSLEVVHISRLDTSNDLVVGEESLLEIWVGEDLSIGDISHKKFDDNLKLQDLSAEGLGTDLGTLTEGLDQTGLSLRILELDSLDAAKIVEVSCVLII